MSRVYSKSVSVDLVGEKQLALLFQTLEPTYGSKILRSATWRAADPMLAEAKRRVRVGNWALRGQTGSAAWRGVKTRTGNRSVHLRDALKIAGKGWATKPKAEARVTYPKTVAHAVFIEYGAQPHRAGPGRRIPHPGHRAWPFLRPAYILNRNRAIDTIRTVAREALTARVNAAKAKINQTWSKTY